MTQTAVKIVCNRVGVHIGKGDYNDRNVKHIHYCKGNQGDFYVFEEDLYDSHFPEEWLDDHEKKEIGPKYCAGCREGSWNGVFFAYCLWCSFQDDEGKFGPGLIRKGDEATMEEYKQYEISCGKMPRSSSCSVKSVFSTYMKGVRLNEIGDTDICDTFNIYRECIIKDLRSGKGSRQMRERLYFENRNNDIELKYFSGSSGECYVYGGVVYTEQFPIDYLKCDKVLRTGPVYCENCITYATWNSACIGYCTNCASVYDGDSGPGFSSYGVDILINDMTTKYGAFQTYLKDVKLSSIGCIDTYDSLRENYNEIIDSYRVGETSHEIVEIICDGYKNR